MIFGIGTDICDVRRIAAAQLRHGDRFAQRVLVLANGKIIADGDPQQIRQHEQVQRVYLGVAAT